MGFRVRFFTAFDLAGKRDRHDAKDLLILNNGDASSSILFVDGKATELHAGGGRM